MAHALGGRTEKFAGGWGAGAHEYRMHVVPSWMEGAGETMRVRAMHQDQVVAVPPHAQVLASSDFCANAALIYGDPEEPVALSVQPHPECSEEFMADLIRARAGDAIPAHIATAGLESLAKPVDTVLWAAWIVRFFHEAVARRARHAAE